MLFKSRPAASHSYLKAASRNMTPRCTGDYTLNECRQAITSQSELMGAFNSGASTIAYDTGQQKFNFCDHTKDEFIFHPDGVLYGMQKRTAYAVACRGPQYYATAYRSGYDLKTPALPPMPLDYSISENLRADAWQQLKPNLNDGHSLINFLLELKDFRDIVKLWPSVLSKIKRINSALSGVNFGLDTAAELLLTYSFFLASLKGDLEDICQSLLDLDRSINKFISEGRESQVYHHQLTLEESEGTKTLNSFGYTCNRVKVHYVATLRCTYTYKKPSQLEGFLRLSGFRLTPEAIWNAIPFSFVVDWVLRIGKFLSQFDEDPNLLRVNIIDYCDSIKSTSSKVFVWDEDTCLAPPVGSTRDFGEFSGKTVWRWDRSHYLRFPGLPNIGYAFPVMDSLSKRELVLSAALLRLLTTSK